MTGISQALPIVTQPIEKISQATQYGTFTNLIQSDFGGLLNKLPQEKIPPLSEQNKIIGNITSNSIMIIIFVIIILIVMFMLMKYLKKKWGK